MGTKPGRGALASRILGRGGQTPPPDAAPPDADPEVLPVRRRTTLTPLRTTLGAVLSGALVLGLAATAPAAGAPGAPAAAAAQDGAFSVAGERAVPDREDGAPAQVAPEPTGRLLVRHTGSLAPTLRGTGLRAAATADGVERLGWTVVDPGTVPVEQAAQALERSAAVVEAVPELRRRSTEAWGTRTGSTLGYLQELRLPDARTLPSGAGTVVAVLDSGVAPHPRLSGRVLPGADLVNVDSDATDDEGHGTAVAFVAAGLGTTAAGPQGVATGAKVLPVKVLDDQGGGDDMTIAEGIVLAADSGAEVINLSLGGPGESSVLRSALQYAVDEGAVVVISSGNSSTDEPMYPAAYAATIPGVLSVSATDDWGQLTDFSSWGDSVSIAAPGWDVVAPYYLDGQYYYWSGTSFSAPMVSGAAARVRQQHPTWDPAQVAAHLRTTARDSGPRGVDPFYGAGVLDVAAALGLGPAVPHDLRPVDAGAPDDLVGQATLRPAANGVSSAAGTISPEGDVDWSRHPAPTAGWYQVDVDLTSTPCCSPALDLVLEVRDGDGRLLLREDSYADGGETATVRVPAAGSYLVGVRGWSGAASLDRYAVTARRVATTLDRFDVAETYPAYLAAGQTPQRTRAGDVDGDGVVDLVTVSASASAATLAAYRGRGDGTFASRLVQPTSSEAFELADLDGDGVDEVVTAGATGQVWSLASGAWVRLPAWDVPAQVDDLRVADLEGDGDPDLAARTPSGRTVWTNTGSGWTGAQESTDLSQVFAFGDATGDGVAETVATPYDDIAIGDVTGDGVPDQVVADGGAEQGVDVLVGQGDGTSTTVPLQVRADDVEIADLDGDGANEVLALSAWSGQSALTVVRVGADGTLVRADRHADVGPWLADEQTQLAVADVDADGWLDLATANQSTGLAVRRQLAPRCDGCPPAFVTGSTVVAHDAGHPVDGAIELQLGADLGEESSSAVADAVQLRDRLGVPVPVTTTLTGRTLRVVPAQALSRGHHYQLHVSGLEDVDGLPMPEPFRLPFTVAADGDRFTPVTPVRLLDTRSSGRRVAAGTSVAVPLTGVPVGATAVVLNVTAVQPDAAGWLTVYPGPGAAPNASNVNAVPGVDQPNLVTVRLGASRDLRVAAGGMSAHVLADLAGYYAPGGATGYVPLAPQRLLDLRAANGPTAGAKLGPQQVVDVQVRGRAGVPADALAVVLNVTGVEPTSSTFVTAYPRPVDGAKGPLASNLNLYPGRDQPNLVTVPIGPTGAVRFANAVGSTYLLADVQGYYSATGDHGFVPLAPTRVADTRTGLGLSGPVTPGTQHQLQVTGVAGVAADARAAVLNVTGVRPDQRTFVQAFPYVAGGTVPTVSTLNLVPGRDEANLAVLTLGPTGAVGLYTPNARLHAVVDVAGYFRR